MSHMTSGVPPIELVDIAVTLHPGHFARMRSLDDNSSAYNLLRHCNIYMIIARPRIDASKEVNPLLGKVIRYRSPSSGVFEAVDFQHGEDASKLDLNLMSGESGVGAIQVRDGGLTVRMPITATEGVDVDATHFAAFAAQTAASERFGEIAKWEILYIGIAQNKEGTRSALNRLENGHKTLRKIEEDYLRRGSEVHVVPIQVKAANYAINQYSEADGPAYDESRHLDLESLVADGPDRATREILGIIENSLIAYFQPKYNIALKKWPASGDVKKLVDIGVRGMFVVFDGTDDIAFLFSPEHLEPRRGFAFYAEFQGAKLIRDVYHPVPGVPTVMAEEARAVVGRSRKSPPTLVIFESDYKLLDEPDTM